MLRQIREDIDSVLERDPAARSRWEVLTCYPGVHALIAHRCAHRLWVGDWKWLARFISHVARWLTGIEIHPGARIGRRVFIDHGMGVVIGETAEVGEECTLYQGVTLGGTSLYRGTKRHPTLGRGVVVGAGAKVLGGFTLGGGGRVGPTGGVSKPAPAGATAVGNPARILEKSDDIQREEMARSLGFSAYGVAQDLPDPIAQALHALLDHAVAQDQRLKQILQALEAAGVRIDGQEQIADDFDPERISKFVD